MNDQRKDENGNKPAGRRAARWGLAAGGAAFGLLLAEIVCRLVIPAPLRVRIEPGAPPANAAPAEIRLPVHPEQGGLYVETPAGRRLRPNTTAIIERHALSGVRVEIRTNSLGYRNAETGPKEGKRILFIGDSITFADYLPEEQTFVHRVGRLARTKGRDWETINAGVGAISLQTELAILVETGLALKPDAVVLGWYLNDFQDSPGVEIRDLPALARVSRLAYALRALAGGSRGEGAATGVDLETWLADWRRDERPALVGHDPLRAAFFRDVERFFFDWGGAWSRGAWERQEPLLDEFRRLARAHGFKPLVMAFPARPQVEAPFDAGQPQARLAAWSAAAGVPLLDLLPVLRQAHAAGDRHLFLDQCHHTPRASEDVLAPAMFAWLEANLKD